MLASVAVVWPLLGLPLRIRSGSAPYAQHPVFVWHPVDLATPDRAAAWGRPSTQPPAELVQLRPRDVVW